LIMKCEVSHNDQIKGNNEYTTDILPLQLWCIISHEMYIASHSIWPVMSQWLVHRCQKGESLTLHDHIHVVTVNK